MAQVRIITEVTAFMSPEVIAEHQITVLPIEILFDNKKYLIEQDNGTVGLFRHMADGPAKPAQATISSNTLQQAYERLCRETGQILVLVSSSKLSQSYSQARIAARPFLGRCSITVLDSMTASWGLGLMVEAAAKAAQEGQPLDEIVRLIRGILPHIYLVFVVERLDYLECGGRIGQAQALLGTMLRIKPLLLVEDGDVIPLEKVRTRTMAIEKLADFVAEFARIQEVVILASPLMDETHALIGDLREQLSLAVPDQEPRVIDYDPVLACHLGPEALGVIVYEGL